MGINSFTLAARKINPKFQTKVLWLSTWYDPAKEADAAKAFRSRRRHHHPAYGFARPPSGLRAERPFRLRPGLGHELHRAQGASDRHRGQLGPLLYRPRQGRDGRYLEDGRYLVGLKQDTVQIAPYNSAMPDNVKKAADDVKNAIIAGTLHPVTGPIADNKGRRGSRTARRRRTRCSRRWIGMWRACRAELHISRGRVSARAAIIVAPASEAIDDQALARKPLK